MTQKQFNLSEKEVDFSLYPNDGCEEMFQKKDVKEFIRLLKEDLAKEYWGNEAPLTPSTFLEIIDKLAGDKLK